MTDIIEAFQRLPLLGSCLLELSFEPRTKLLLTLLEDPTRVPPGGLCRKWDLQFGGIVSTDLGLVPGSTAMQLTNHAARANIPAPQAIPSGVIEHSDSECGEAVRFRLDFGDATIQVTARSYTLAVLDEIIVGHG